MPDKNDLSHLLPRAAYLVVRPTFEFGDYTCTALLDDAEECQLQMGFPDRPPTVVEFFSEFPDALDAALALRLRQPSLAVWYDGGEMRSKISGWRGLGLALADHCGWEPFAGAMAAHDEIKAGQRTASSLDLTQVGEAIVAAVLSGRAPRGPDLLITAIQRALNERP